MAAALTVDEQVRQLNDARKLVLQDVSFYRNVIQGILPIISGAGARLELRRWGADFLAEAFATPALPSGDKETMLLTLLDALRDMLERPGEDGRVLASLVQTAASIYPLAMRWTINNSYDTITWEKMVAIKDRILRIWDSAVPSVKICCIKFAQRIVLSQTPAMGMAVEKRGDGLEVSLDKVPPNHPTLDTRTLEAVAVGLLDRILSVLQDNSSDALMVDATLNSLSILIRTRPGTSNRILNAVLNFNPLKLANSPMTPKTRVIVRSLEKTTRMLLVHLLKRDPHNTQNPRIQQHLERLMRSRAEIFDEVSRKRALEGQQHDDTEHKRQRTSRLPSLQITPLAPGPHSLADIFTLTTTEGLRTFEATAVPAGIAAKICMSTLSRVDGTLFARAVEGVRARLTAAETASGTALDPNTAPLDVEDDDDYEPDYYAAEDTEQILNKLDGSDSKQLAKIDESEFGVKSFRLPTPPPMTTHAAEAVGNEAVDRLLTYLKARPDGSKHNPKAGVNRLAARFNDRESWFTFASRLASRQENEEPPVKDEDAAAEADAPAYDQQAHIRDTLYTYVLEDFRRRIDAAVSWLNEEWYTEEEARRAGRSSGSRAPGAAYEEWTLKVLDGILPYLTPQDRSLTRFLGELPELTPAMLARVRLMCRDPSVVPLALTTLLYLVMMRPPVKELALDTVQEIWTEYEDARPMATKYLSKYRPAFLEASTSGAVAPSATAIAA